LALTRPHVSTWAVLLVAAFFAVAVVLSTTPTNVLAEPVNDHRVVPGCHGEDDFDSQEVGFGIVQVVNIKGPECPIRVLAYDTHGCADLDECDQHFVAQSQVVNLKPGAKVTISVKVPSNICEIQLDPLVGWIPDPIDPLRRGDEYGTNMLAGGKGFTGGFQTNPKCKEETPTPTPETPTPSPTPETPTPPPTPTNTPTATPTQATPTKTPVPPTATPTDTVPPKAPTEVTPQPTVAAPKAEPTPKGPSTGSGLANDSTTGVGIALMIVGVALGGLIVGRSTRRR
jgi:hypothetical protein